MLRPLADRPKSRPKFLLLGSASPELVKGVSESLAGRAGFVDLGGLDLTDIGGEKQDRLWLRGGFPRSFLAKDEASSLEWRQNFIRTFLERDMPQLGIHIPSATLLRFWTMIAHYHGQIWNGAELARALGLSEKTVRNYLDLLTGAFVVRQLAPWFENTGKRQYKAPKVYVRDSGLLHALLSVEDRLQLAGHPKYGASWEGFALEQALSAAGTRQAFFWGTHGGAELDLMLMRGGKRYGVEFKCADAPAGFHRRESPSCRSHDGEMIPHQARSVIQARLDVGSGEFRIFLQHILDGVAGGEEFQDCLRRNARAANHRSTVANIRFDRNAFLHLANDTWPAPIPQARGSITCAAWHESQPVPEGRRPGKTIA